MAVIIGTELVNNGQSGWDKSHVLTALEKVFYEMGFNSGSQEDGVPTAVLFPGYDTSTSLDFQYCISYSYDSTPTAYGNAERWGRCGGPAPTALLDNNLKTRRFYVTNSTTSSWQIAEELKPTSTGSNSVIDIDGNMGTDFITGTKLTYNGQGNDVINGLSAGNVYYMRRVDDNNITLHNTQNDALNDTNIVTTTYTSMSDPKSFRTDAQTNPTITIGKGDYLYWHTSDHNAGGEFRLFEASKGLVYTSNRSLHDADNLQTNFSQVSGSGTYASPYYWNTAGWWQTENEVLDETQISGTGVTGLHAYGYASDTHATMKGEIVINPQLDGYNIDDRVYWKHTVSGAAVDAAIGDNAGRTDLKLRIFRDDGYNDKGQVSGILICNKATGWSDNDVFTIPGTAIGGTSPANDIKFGTNANETNPGDADGFCNILTTNLGAGANMFQKHPDGDYGVLRLENDASKKFGTTYWGFSFNSNNYQLKIASGSGWSYLNRLGKHFVYDQSYQGFFGAFNGTIGLDYSDSTLNRDSTTYWYNHSYASSAGGQNYPLKIRYHKAQAPQDSNFATISFIQTINSVDEVYLTFALHKGSNFGANVWDYDECFLGTYSLIWTNYQWNGFQDTVRGNWVEMRYITPGYDSTGNAGPNAEPINSDSMAREGSYGYLRNTTGRYIADTRYKSNIDTQNEGNEREVYMYYRNNTYDFIDFTGQTSYPFTIKADMKESVGVQYYKPMKGLPICDHLIPCPYYIPDDFVMIHAEVTPGATEFLPGDTVTISTDEVYTVITADQLKNQTGLDGQSNNTANGMLFCARI